ncbi:MAG: universal stress protein [Desulfobacteraceae bacterium]
MLENVLFPVKCSESLNRLTDMAEFLKIFNTKTISILCVGSAKGKKQKTFVEELETAVLNLGFQVDVTIRTGSVVDEIINVAAEKNTSFICFAYKGKSPLKRALFGDVTTDVIRLSDIPVFVYKGPPLFKKSQPATRVMYTTGLSDTDIKILNYLKSKELKADELLLFHAGHRAPDPRSEAERIEKVQERLSLLEQKCQGSFSRIEKKDAVGSSVTNAIVSQAKKGDVDFIVLGKSDKYTPFQMMAGSTAETLPRKAKCPVLIIPGIYEGIAGMTE